MKYLIVAYRDSELGSVAVYGGVLYKENDSFFVVYSFWDAFPQKKVSWSSKFDFMAIPKKYVVKTEHLKEL